MFDVSGRIAAIATAQRAWLLSAPPLQTALRMFLDVIAPDAVRKKSQNRHSHRQNSSEEFAVRNLQQQIPTLSLGAGR